MTWTKPDPFATGLGVATSVLAGQQQGKQAAADAARQAELDRQAAINAGVENTLKGAQTTEANARTTGLQNTAIWGAADEAAKARERGDGLTPLTMPTVKPGEHISARDQAKQWTAHGTALLNRGQHAEAKESFDRADKLNAQAKIEDDHELAVKTQAEKALQDLALRNHWGADEKQKAKDELGRMIRQARQSGTSLEVAAMNGVNAMARTVVTQGGAAERAAAAQAAALHRVHYTEDNANRRFNVGLRHKDAKPPKPPGFRGIDPTTAMLMTKQMKEAIAAGADRTAVFAEAARLHGISPVEVEGLYGDYAGTGS